MLDGKKILVAEDDKDVVEMYQDYFAVNKDTKKAIFTCTYDYKTTKEALDNNSFDVLLLDLGLGDFSPPPGLAILKEFAKKIKIVVVSAYDEYREECLGLGAFEFFAKPTDMTLIVEMLKKACGKE